MSTSLVALQCRAFYVCQLCVADITCLPDLAFAMQILVFSLCSFPGCDEYVLVVQ